MPFTDGRFQLRAKVLTASAACRTCALPLNLPLVFFLPLLPKAQSSQDPGVYGVVQSGDHIGRTCVVKWFKLKSSGDDVEVSTGATQ